MTGSDDVRDVLPELRGAARAWWAAGAVAVVLLGGLTALVAAGWSPLVTADHVVVDTVNAALAPHPVLVAIVRAVTDAGSPLAVDIVTAAVALLLLVRKRPWPAAYLVLVRALELGVEQTLKQALDRPRPTPAVVLATAQGAAFPSGHTAGTAALCLALLIVVLPNVRRTGRTVAVVAAALATAGVAASRVLLGVHFPSDVVGGILVGGLSALVTAAAIMAAARATTTRRSPRRC